MNGPLNAYTLGSSREKSLMLKGKEPSTFWARPIHDKEWETQDTICRRRVFGSLSQGPNIKESLGGHHRLSLSGQPLDDRLWSFVFDPSIEETQIGSVKALMA